MKNILLIGGTGFIGKNLIDFLLATNTYRIHLLLRRKSNSHKKIVADPRVKIFEADLDERDILTTILKEQNIHTVVHLSSALKPGSGAELFYNECKQIITPTIVLLAICSELDILFVYFSSGGAIYGSDLNRPHCENDALKPISYYGLSKYFLEEAIRFEHRSSGLKYLILRPSNPFGPGQSANGTQGLIAIALEKIINQEKISIWGDGGAIRDYLYIDDLCMYVQKLLALGSCNETYNLGSGYGVSVKEIIETISEVLDIQPEIEFTDARSFDVRSSILDISKIIRRVGNVNVSNLEGSILHFANIISNKHE
jgi:UDP-glucose 4-epimerase